MVMTEEEVRYCRMAIEDAKKPQIQLSIEMLEKILKTLDDFKHQLSRDKSVLEEMALAVRRIVEIATAEGALGRTENAQRDDQLIDGLRQALMTHEVFTKWKR